MMINSIKRYTLVLGLLLAVLTATAKVTLGFKGESSATVGIYVKEIATGQVIAENNADMAMSPASVMKALTAASVYSTFNPNFRFETNVYLTGNVKNSVCTGDLIISSCGDPTIDSENLYAEPTFCSEITTALLGAGIKEIKGTVIVEETMPDAGVVPTWEVDDVPWAYGAGHYGFNYRDNVFKLWPATKKTVPYVPDLDVKVITSKNFNLKRGIDSNRLIVYGSKPNNKNWDVNTTMNNPAAVVKHELIDLLNEHGIAVSNQASGKDDDRILLYVHRSEPLHDILRQMMVHSHNLYAEGMLRAQAPDKTREEAVEQELAVWTGRGITSEYAAVIDGSGLSRANRLQPRMIADVLEWMANSEYAEPYVAFFPKVGVEGTVKSFLKDTPLTGKLALKTGSMNAVQCYAGYKLDDAGTPTHVVVILINAFYCPRAELRKSISTFLLDTFNDNKPK